MSFGGVFFIAHVIWTFALYRHAIDHNHRVEAAGAVVPGLSGLAIGLATMAPLWLSVCLLPAAAINVILGRAIYELVCMRLGLFRDEAV